MDCPLSGLVSASLLTHELIADLHLAERQGFEPWTGITCTHFPGVRLRPLGHLSAYVGNSDQSHCRETANLPALVEKTRRNSIENQMVSPNLYESGINERVDEEPAYADLRASPARHPNRRPVCLLTDGPYLSQFCPGRGTFMNRATSTRASFWSA